MDFRFEEPSLRTGTDCNKDIAFWFKVRGSGFKVRGSGFQVWGWRSGLCIFSSFAVLSSHCWEVYLEAASLGSSLPRTIELIPRGPVVCTKALLPGMWMLGVELAAPSQSDVARAPLGDKVGIASRNASST